MGPYRDEEAGVPFEPFKPVVERLSKDVKEAVKVLSEREARYLVDTYYQMQENRKRSANQTRAAEADAEPHKAIQFMVSQNTALENRVKQMLEIWSGEQKLGQWARSNVGIGPVIAAGLLAHIDIAKAPTAGHIWSFAGLDPRTIWMGKEATIKELHQLFIASSKVLPEDIRIACDHFRRSVGTITRQMDGKRTWTVLATALARRPWNTPLKTLCWKIGDSFVKVSGKENAFYGLLYRENKAKEVARNVAGDFATQAANVLRKTPSHKQKATYAEGRLPDGHVDMRARRATVKLFLSHYHEIGYRLLHGKEPARPWAIEHGGHTHYIPPPNAEGI